jgi:hypothetical protein
MDTRDQVSQRSPCAAEVVELGEPLEGLLTLHRATDGHRFSLLGHVLEASVLELEVPLDLSQRTVGHDLKNVGSSPLREIAYIAPRAAIRVAARIDWREIVTGGNN